jgi:hypothetical protein
MEICDLVVFWLVENDRKHTKVFAPEKMSLTPAESPGHRILLLSSSYVRPSLPPRD